MRNIRHGRSAKESNSNRKIQPINREKDQETTSNTAALQYNPYKTSRIRGSFSLEKEIEIPLQ